MAETTDEKKDEKELSFQSIIPYLGSFIIFLGVIRLMFFYWSFNVNIISYLEFSEIVTSFFDILFIVFFGLVVATAHWFAYTSKKENERSNKLLIMSFNTNSFWKRLVIYISLSFPLLGAMIGYIVGIGIIKIFNKTVTWEFGLQYIYGTLIGFIIGVIILEINVKHHKLGSSKNHKFFSGLLILSILLFVFTVESASTEVKYRKDKKDSYGTTIYLDDSTKLISDSTNYYIGKTQNYLFFYHEKAKTTDVYPMDRVKQLTFKDNKK